MVSVEQMTVVVASHPQALDKMILRVMSDILAKGGLIHDLQYSQNHRQELDEFGKKTNVFQTDFIAEIKYMAKDET